MDTNNFSKYSGCSAIILRNEDTKVFIAQRKLTKEFGGGLWETIGGGIEKQDKDFEACIKREVREELNVDIKKIKEFKDYIFHAENRRDYLIKTFLVELASDPMPNINDFESYGWFNKDEIKNMNFVSNCKQRLEEYFAINSLEESK